jgi:hypothetical protein
MIFTLYLVRYGSRVSRIEEAIFNKKEFDNKARISASCNSKNANVGRHERVIIYFDVSKPALKRDNLFCVISLHISVKKIDFIFLPV